MSTISTANGNNSKVFELAFPNPKFRMDVVYDTSISTITTELDRYPITFSISVEDEIVTPEIIPNRIDQGQWGSPIANDLKHYFMPHLKKPKNKVSISLKSGRVKTSLSDAFTTEFLFNLSVIPDPTFTASPINTTPSIYHTATSESETFVLTPIGLTNPTLDKMGLIPLDRKNTDPLPNSVTPLQNHFLGSNDPNSPAGNYLAYGFTFPYLFNNNELIFYLIFEGYGENSTTSIPDYTPMDPGPNFYKPSFYYPGNGDSSSYEDAYGRLINLTNYFDSRFVTGISANGDNIYYDNINLATGERIKYEKIQGFWSPNGIAINDNDLFRSNTIIPEFSIVDDDYIYFSNTATKKVGETYTFYVITEKGHIGLKITRAVGANFFEPSIEPIVVFKDLEIDITQKYFPQGSLTDAEYKTQMDSYVQSVPDPTTVNNSVVDNIFYIVENTSTLPSTFNVYIKAKASTQFSIGARTLNIKVIEKPIPKNIYLFIPSSAEYYNLLDFFDLDHDLDTSFIEIIGTPSNTVYPVSNDPKFNFQPTTAETLTVKIFGETVGTFTMIAGSVKTIFEKLERIIDPKNYIVGLQGNHKITSVASSVLNGISVSGETFEILDETVSEVTCSLSYGRGVLDVVIPIIVIEDSAFRNYIPYGRKFQIPKLTSIPTSEIQISITDQNGTKHTYNANTSGFTISLPNTPGVAKPDFSPKEYSTYWEVTPKNQILIYAQRKKTPTSNVTIKQILLTPVERFIDDGQTEIYVERGNGDYATMPFPNGVIFRLSTIFIPVVIITVFGPQKINPPQNRYQIYSENYDFIVTGESLVFSTFTSTTDTFMSIIKASSMRISFVQNIRFPILKGITPTNAPGTFIASLPDTVVPASSPLLNFVTTETATYGTKVMNMINISVANVNYPQLQSKLLVYRVNPNILGNPDRYYEFLEFEQLPKIDLTQKIYYTNDTTFAEVLSRDNRRYFFSDYPNSGNDLMSIGNNLTDADYDLKINDVIGYTGSISPSFPAPPFSVSTGTVSNLFVQYGELISLVVFAKFNGTQNLQQIFIESEDITAVNLHSGGLQSDFLNFPSVGTQIQKTGYIITKTTTGFKFTKTDLNTDIPEYFMVTTTGEVVLLVFENIPINKLKVKIYLSQTFSSGGSLYTTDSLPALLVDDSINSATYQNYLLSSTSSGDITITRPSDDSPLVDFYLYDGNTINHVIFENLPKLTKDDVYLFDTTNLWNPTVPYQIVSNATLNGTNVQITDTSQPAILKLDTTSTSTTNIPGSTLIQYADYAGAVFTFKIIQVNSIQEITILHNKKSATTQTLNAGEEIISFGQDPSQFMPITQSQNITLNHVNIHVQKNNFIITPNSIGSSKFYVRRKNSGGEMIPLIYRIDVVTAPLPSKLTLEILTTNSSEYPIDGIYDTISASVKSNITVQKVFNGSVDNSNLNLKEGTNLVYYQYYNHPNYTGSNYQDLLELEVDVKLVPIPKALTFERFLRLGQTVDINLIQEVFGETAGHSIVSVSLVTGPSSAALTASNLVIDSTGKKLTVNVQTTGDEGTYVFSIQYISTTISQKFLQTNVQGQIKFYVWDPSNSSTVTIVKAPSSVNYVETYQDLGITGTFSKIEYNGNVLEGTKHNALDWSKSDEFEIGSKSQYVDNYILYTEDTSNDELKVYLLNVIIIKPPSNKVIFYETGQTRNVDLISEFFPLLGDKLIDTEIDLTANGLVTDLQNVPISSTTLSPATYSIQITNSAGTGNNGTFTTASSILITTIQFTTSAITPPIQSLNPVEFLVPLGSNFEIKSTDVSPDGTIILQTPSTDTGVSTTQKTGSIIVYGNATTAPSSTTFTIVLQKDFIVTPTITVTIEFYDPNNTTHVTKISYFNTFIYDFSKASKSYVYENITYQPENKIPPVPLNQPVQPNFVSVQNILDGVNPKTRVFVDKYQNINHFIILIRMLDGTISILDVRFITPSKLTKKYYVVVREQTDPPTPANQATIRISDISNFSVTFDPDTGNPSNSQTFSFDNNFGNSTVTPYLEVETSFGNTPINFVSNGGLEVGTVMIPIPAPSTDQIIATSLFSSGTWQDFVVLVKATHSKESLTGQIETTTTTLLSVSIDIETLADIIVIDQDVILEIGNNLDFDMQDFVVDGIGKVTFTNWNFNNTNSLPAGFTSDGRFLRTTSPVLTATTYDITATAKSLQLSSLNKTISFKLIIYDPNSNLVQRKEAILVDLLPYTLPFSTAISSINGQVVTNNATINSVRISVQTNALMLQALSRFSNDFTFEVITRDGTLNFVHISQVENEKDINITAFEYSGEIFKTTDQLVASYTISTDPTTRIPGTLYSLPGSGQIKINADGSFDVQSTNVLTVTILTNVGRTIVLTVGGNQHQTKTIVESPPTEIPLGSGLINVKINQQILTSTLDLGYAAFTVNNSGSLQIFNVRSNFQETLLQYENIVDDKIQISSVLIDINRSPNSQVIFKTITNSVIRFTTEFPISALTYNSMDLKPNGQSITLFKQGDDKKIGSFSISGNAVDITSNQIEGISRPIGLYNEDTKSYLYLIVEIENNNSADEMSALPGENIQSLDGSPYVTIGLLDGSEIVSVENVSLSGRIQIQGGDIVILSPSIIGDFRFYGVTQNGTFTIFNIKYIHRTIVVNNINQILIAAFLGGDEPPLVFSDPGITLDTRYVQNPNGLSVLHTTRPFYGRWTIETA